jgi:hypothetical protein
MNRKEFIKLTLEQVKEMTEKSLQLSKLGVDIIDLDTGADLLVKSIPFMFFEDENEVYEYIVDLIFWWLYEDVDKKVTLEDGNVVNVENVDDFIKFLYGHYSL